MRWITDMALVLAIALVAARMLMAEPITRSLDNPLPGITAPPMGPGPATGLLLDLCCWLPAFMVLLRRLVDSKYTLRWSGALLAMFSLGVFAMASIAWASNKFGAAVSAFHLFSAMVLLWSAMQSVRSWVHFRLVAGICAGLLLGLAVRGYDDHFIELPIMRANWDKEKDQVMLEHHWTPTSFDYHQFELRVLGEEVMGFSQSANTYAGLLVLLGTVSAGILLDRVTNAGKSGEIGWGLGVVAVAGIAIPLIHFTQCRAAYVTPLLTVACLAGLAPLRKYAARHARAIFLYTAAAIAAGVTAVVAFGIARGNLIHSSLTFRWWYWIGSMRLIRAHWLCGVGWGNFGPSYLAVRLPIASEEIIDPHNFIVRFFTELGCIGGVLLLVWLIWTAWDLTAGAATRSEQSASEAKPGIADWRWWLLTPAFGAILINAFGSIDFTQISAFVISEMANRVYWLAALALGVGVALLRMEPATKGQIVLGLNDDAAPWTVRAMLIGVGMFLVHNLIEFGIFEPGPMFLIALLIGGLLGLRLEDRTWHSRGGRAAGVALFAGVGVWIAAAALLVAPVTIAEGRAQEGADLIRMNQPDAAQSAFELAAAEYPSNAEYWLHAANAALLRRPAGVSDAMRLLARAIATDPKYVDAYVERARCEGSALAIADFRRALAIDPNNVRLRLDLAGLLAKAGRSAEGNREFATASAFNAALELHDPKRLSAKEIEQNRPVR